MPDPSALRDVASRERTVCSGDLKLNVVEWGAAGAPVIVMLHGLRAYGRTWSRVATALADRYHVIALDQRGRGKSDWGPTADYFTPAYVEDLKNVADALELRRFILLGHSMGGATALVFSQLYPEYLSGLVIEDIGPGSSAGSLGSDRIKAELNSTPRIFESREHARIFWRQARPGAPNAAIEERLVYMMTEEDDGSLRWRYDLEGISEARLDPDLSKIADLWPPVEALSIPTLVLRGAKTDFLPANVMAEMIARNTHIRGFSVSDASHYIHDDNYDEFMQRLEDYLAELPPALSPERD